MENLQEEVYKVEMIITFEKGIKKEVDDLIFDSCKDAPFFIDSMTITKFKE